MKKKIIIFVSALLLAVSAIGVYAAINWEGSENVTNIKNNLTLIQGKIDNLKDENSQNDKEYREIEILLEQEKALREQKERELQDKQKEIENKNKEINDKNKVIESKDQEIRNKDDQLRQALEDVKSIEQITEQMAK